MGRPRCDPFDAKALSKAIDAGEVTALRAYAAYASVAARPYARASWEKFINESRYLPAQRKSKEHVYPEQVRALDDDDEPSYWDKLSPVKPANVLTTIAEKASLSIKTGALYLNDGDRKITYEKRAIKPLAIVITGFGGYVSIEAMRFCRDHGIAVIVLEWSRDFMAIIAPPAKQSGSLIRAQAACDSLPIAKAVIRAKIEAHANLGAISPVSASKAIDSLNRAATVAAILIIEAQAARLAWVEHTVAMQWREAGSVPKGWKLPYNLRRRMTGATAKGATDPINSLLNLSLAVTIGLTVALAYRGLSPALGVIPKSPRWPLSYDAIEPLRPHIEAATFKFIERNKFSRYDFHTEKTTGRVKATTELSRAIIDATAIPQRLIDKTVDWIVGFFDSASIRK